VQVSSTGQIEGRFTQDLTSNQFDYFRWVDFGGADQVYGIRSDGKIQKLVDGVPDTSFATASLLTQPSGSFQIRADDQGKLYVLGSANNQLFVKRYTASGVLDTGFGSGGTVTFANQSFSSLGIKVEVQHPMN
jgi:hypothetical protein